MFVLAAFTYAHGAWRTGPRSVLALALVTVWALSLSFYITWRNWGHSEDRRYKAIRARNGPHFPIKSLYSIFGLQALLAWVISLPLLAALLNPGPLRVLNGPCAHGLSSNTTRAFLPKIRADPADALSSMRHKSNRIISRGN